MKKFWIEVKYFFLFIWYYKKLFKINLHIKDLELGTILESNNFKIKIYQVAKSNSKNYYTYYVKSI